MGASVASALTIDRLTASAFTIPTDRPESDGTFSWNSTTILIVEATSGATRGLGYTYGSPATSTVVRDHLVAAVSGRDPMNVRGSWDAMIGAVRNIGRPGIASHAIAAVDTSLWDLKARLLGIPLATLIGAARHDVPVYGSGGFTSYSEQELTDQLADWAEAGIRAVKMKVGRDPARDTARVRAARRAVGPDVELFVDANGAYARKDALRHAEAFAAERVTWFEEPVSSDDIKGLHVVRDRAPAGMAVAAGEYGYDLAYFRRMLAAGAVDVLQADATRCAGITGFLQAGALSEAFGVPLSAHTAPALHVAPCCALQSVQHIEYFHDHVRIERLLFDGCPELRDGRLHFDPAAPGHGLIFKRSDAERYAVG
jgi:L-alanine-DL-glutamate epimerase-like enolase superfamily enzyme